MAFVISGIPDGSYIVRCSFIAYSTIEIPLLAGELNRNFDLGKIVLAALNQHLDEVIIRAKREIVSSGLDEKNSI